MVAESHDELLTPAGVAALLYVDPKTVTRWAAAGKLASVRTPGGHRRYLRSEVLAMVADLYPDRHGDGDDRVETGPRPRPTTGRTAGPARQAAAAAVVAEAVALAMEAAAAAAAESVLVTAAAVAEAAHRAADAAERAREARAAAAQAAARSVADEAARTATHVQQHAAQVAAQVQRAASVAAVELARTIDRGVAPDAALLAGLIAATVQAAADATDHDITQAATAVKHADSAAAAKVATTTAAAEALVASAVSATADAQCELANATAASMALDTDARAAAIALTARDAAAALLFDEHRTRTVETTSEDVERLAAELSHDLRGSLTSIIANMELLETELANHPETVVTLLGRATRSSKRMALILDHFMMPRPAEEPLALPGVDLAAVLEQVLLESADLLERTGAVVEVGELPIIGGDSHALHSVLQNLLTNSIKFARPGVPATIQVGARPTRAGWRISVRDDGIGLADAGDVDVFALFSRGTSAACGHGIGLATVARIVAEHRGRVGTGCVAGGAEIWFELPG